MKQGTQSNIPKAAPPTKMRDKDFIGRDVILLRDVTTNGGQRFAKGTRMRVYGAWRGHFHLDSVTPKGRIRIRRGCSVGVRHISRSSFMLAHDGLGGAKDSRE